MSFRHRWNKLLGKMRLGKDTEKAVDNSVAHARVDLDKDQHNDDLDKGSLDMPEKKDCGVWATQVDYPEDRKDTGEPDGLRGGD